MFTHTTSTINENKVMAGPFNGMTEGNTDSFNCPNNELGINDLFAQSPDGRDRVTDNELDRNDFAQSPDGRDRLTNDDSSDSFEIDDDDINLKSELGQWGTEPLLGEHIVNSHDKDHKEWINLTLSGLDGVDIDWEEALSSLISDDVTCGLELMENIIDVGDLPDGIIDVGDLPDGFEVTKAHYLQATEIPGFDDNEFYEEVMAGPFNGIIDVGDLPDGLMIFIA